jgi:hypothetical protein
MGIDLGKLSDCTSSSSVFSTRADLPQCAIHSTMGRMTSLTPQTFVDKWRHATLKERSAYQELLIL